MSGALFDPDEFADAAKVITSALNAPKVIAGTFNAPLTPDTPAEPDKPLPLGTRVLFSHQLFRYTEAKGYQARKVWAPHPYYADAEKTRTGIIVGKRTLSNGRRVWEDYGDGGSYEFIPDEHFTAYLVAYDLHRKPVHVRPEHVHPELTTA